MFNQSQRAKEVAAIILSQLGGRKFIAMTGAGEFIALEPTKKNAMRYGISMSIGRNSSKANCLKVYLDYDDTYTMQFLDSHFDSKDYKYKEIVIKELKTVYCDQLQELFTQVTGMYTSL